MEATRPQLSPCFPISAANSFSNGSSHGTALPEGNCSDVKHLALEGVPRAQAGWHATSSMLTIKYVGPVKGQHYSRPPVPCSQDSSVPDQTAGRQHMAVCSGATTFNDDATKPAAWLHQCPVAAMLPYGQLLSTSPSSSH